MACRSAGIEPSHDCLMLRGAAFRKGEGGVVGWLRALGINCEKSCIQHCSINAEDTDQMMFVYVVRQKKPLGSRRQDTSGDLNRPIKCDFDGLIRLIRACSRQDNQKRKQ